ncbi:class I SAM-dependent methyltransferase [Oculatella sp. LEGE 06141]|uniref:class I SAM-dependent methyltransferase n=1 Tax=Oculatella sp. LEGE 06141 TaxID=1828648 RepID=UPI0018820EBD|nr:class I SAM-dependent methyltransferase [Oculatella sp. LEGE 06141]MBE9177198.1 class I SAM-dependent methyltransferase [Oculatella sp. LEGE 06141]
MNPQASELIEKIRQQFDFGPYPRIPLEKSPKDDANSLFVHNLVTPYYRRYRRVIDTKDKLILDAGCGTGYKSLCLAIANPGAKVVGVDISEESVKLARQRLQHHGFNNAEFHAIDIENLPALGLQFDYINCDEVLYLFPDITVGLRAMKAVLNPQGIIRSNLHSYMQRMIYFRAQKVCKLMGLMDDNPTDMEMEIVTETMRSLKDGVDLKARGWNPAFEGEDSKEQILMNYLFQGDKGFTIPDLFNLLRQADLEFFSMVNWRHWDITDLFKDSDDLPVFWAMGLSETSIETRLHLFELLHPVHRLLDFWCTHSNQPEPPTAVDDWEEADWRNAQVSLHPQLRTAKFKQDLIDGLTNHKPFEISSYIMAPALAPVFIGHTIAACILKLWEAPQTVMALVQHWLQIQPINPITLAPLTEADALHEVSQFVNQLEAFLYVLPEPSH